MAKSSRKGPQLVGLFLLGCLLFSYPLITLFNVHASILGVPVLYAYLFGAWAMLIMLVALIMERSE